MLLIFFITLLLWPRRLTANTYVSGDLCNFGIISVQNNLFCGAKNCQITVVLIWGGCFLVATYLWKESMV